MTGRVFIPNVFYGVALGAGIAAASCAPAFAATADASSIVAGLTKAANASPMPGAMLAEIIRNDAVRDRYPVLDLSGVFFRSGSDRLNRRSRDALKAASDAIKAMLARNAGELFLIEGHTDAAGPAAFNEVLSQRRAEQVRITLIRQFGVPAAALLAVGYGERFLKVPSKRSASANRRVSLRRITGALVKPPMPASAPGFLFSKTLPFVPPMAQPPAFLQQPKPMAAPVMAKPAMAPTPFDLTPRALPFTPPMAQPPAFLQQPKPMAAPVMAKPVMAPKPFDLTPRALPFVPPMAEPPAFLQQPRPMAAPAMAKPAMAPKPFDLTPRALPFVPPMAQPPAFLQQPRPMAAPVMAKPAMAPKPFDLSPRALPFVPPVAQLPAFLAPKVVARAPIQPVKPAPVAPKAATPGGLPFVPPVAQMPAFLQQPAPAAVQTAPQGAFNLAPRKPAFVPPTAGN